MVDYQPADLTATVEAGIALAELQRHLASGGKTLPLEAPLSGSATIGGILATGASGPMRASYGCPGTGSSASAWSGARAWIPSQAARW